VTVQILVGDCRDTLRGLPHGYFHTCVTSPPYWGLRDYGTPPLSWPAITYAPLAGLPACVDVPAMECSLGLEPTLEAFIGHMVLVFREVRRTLRDDGTLWLNMGDSYAGSRRGGNSHTITGEGADESKRAAEAMRGGHQAFTEQHKAASGEAFRSMTASRRRDDEPIPRSDVRIPGLKPKDLVGQPWRLALALQADGWWLRSDVIWHKPNPMPESTKDRPTKAHEYVFLLSKSERYYYDADAIKEPASEDTHARYARGRSDVHKHSVAAVPGQKPNTIARSFEHMRKPVGGWQSGPGSHTAIEHQQQDDSRHGKLIQVPTGRKMAQDRAAKNNGDFHAAMAVMPGTRNKRSVWTIVTEGYKEAHFATFPTKLVEPCILAGSPEGGNVLDCFGGSGTTGLVADRLGRNAVVCELNRDYAGMGDRRIAGDRGHVARQRGMELGHE
jgi:DNA modification methylase